MLSIIADSEGLCLKISDLLESDSSDLSKYLRGDVFDAYMQLLQVENEKVDKTRKMLQQVEQLIQNY